MRVRWANILLAIVSTGAAYLAAEARFSFWGLQHVPLRLHADLPQSVPADLAYRPPPRPL